MDTFYRTFTFLHSDLGTRHQQRIVFLLDVSNSKSDKAVKDLAKNAPDIKFWNRKLENKTDDGAESMATFDGAKTFINGVFESAEKDLGDQAEKDIQALGPAPIAPDIGKFKDGKDNPDYLAALEKFNNDDPIYKKGKKDIEDAKGHISNDYGALKTTVTEQTQAAFEARDAVIKKVKDNTEAALNGAVDPEDAREYAENAAFASDAGDDGADYLNSEYSVRNYLDQKIKNLGTGKTEEVQDRKTEDIVQGLVAKLHIKGKNKAEDPALKFMQKLSQQESASGDILSTDDRGVGIIEVTSNILDHVGVPMGSHTERLAGEKTEAAKVVNKIVLDPTMAPQLKGMILAKFAAAPDDVKTNPTKRAQLCEEVNSMYNILKASEHGTIDKIGGYANHRGAYLVGGTVLAILAPVAGLGIDSYISGKIDQSALKNAAAVYAAAEDLVNSKPFDTAVDSYEAQIKKDAGTRNTEVDELIEQYNQGGRRRDQDILPKLQLAIHKNTEITKLKAKAETYKPLYTFYGIPKEFPLTRDAIEALDGETKRESFDTNLRGLDGALVSKLQPKADAMKKSTNEAIDGILAYRKKYTDNNTNGEVQKLPMVSDTNYQRIEESDPAKLKPLIETLLSGPMPADHEIVKANQEALDNALKTGAEGHVPTGAAGGGAPGDSTKSADSKTTVDTIAGKDDKTKVEIPSDKLDEDSTAIFNKQSLKHPKNYIPWILAEGIQTKLKERDPGNYKVTLKETDKPDQDVMAHVIKKGTVIVYHLKKKDSHTKKANG